MADTPSIALAFAAGTVSFLSPCCLPLVPGYLAAVTGRPAEERRRRLDPKVLGRSALFVSTFSIIFIGFGLTATKFGSFLFDNQQALNQVAGVLIVTMGLLLIAMVFVTRLNRDWRPRGLIEQAGHGGPVVAGAAFALAWTPCVGPTLAAILGLAATSQGTLEGGLLLAVYSAGLALPFIFCAIAFDSATTSFSLFRRFHAQIQVASGAVLVGMGWLVLSGELFRLNIEVQQFLERYGLNFFTSV